MRNQPRAKRTIGCGRFTGREPMHPSKLDDEALLARVLDNDEGAWREMLRRYGGDVNRKIAAVLGRYWRAMRATDTLDEIRGDFYLALTSNGMSRLRAFDADRGSLKSWLLTLAQHVVSDHMKRLAHRPLDESLDVYLDEEDVDAQRGAQWVGRGL